jgi:hypothetical protein
MFFSPDIICQVIHHQSSSDAVDIDDKLNSFKDEIIQQMNVRGKAAEERLSSKLDEKFSDLVRLLRGG